MAGRTDPHRPGAIIPADYEYVVSFSGSHTVDGWPCPPVNMDRVVELLRTERFAGIHATNACDVCGSYFIHGDVWKHEPTGEHITIGHICAAKYEFLAERGGWERARGTALAAVRRAAERREARAAIREALVAYPGLGKALRTKHYITEDIRARFIRTGWISEKAAALVFKLAREAAELAAEESEASVPAPTGRVTVEARVLGTKTVDGYYGPCSKMLIKVSTEAGCWKAWGTRPSGLCPPGGLKGATVRFTAAFEPKAGEESFAYFKRPTKASVVAEAPGSEEAVA